jgi:hypothetical protein
MAETEEHRVFILGTWQGKPWREYLDCVCRCPIGRDHEHGEGQPRCPVCGTPQPVVTVARRDG